MTTDLQELRKWAAEVCRHTLFHNGSYMTRRGTHVLEPRWEPDQNIAQAFEVLDATIAKLYEYGKSLKYQECNWTAWKISRQVSLSDETPIYRCEIEARTAFGHVGKHECLPRAILLACYQAAKGASDGKG